MRVFFVAYPLSTVSDSSCGGAEQILYTLDNELSRRSCETMVAACRGSRVAGQLVETGDPALCFGQLAAREAKHNKIILDFLRRAPQPDVIHDQGGRFWTNALAVDCIILATLHLPRSFYPFRWFSHVPKNVFFNCVSESQAIGFHDVDKVVAVIRNGIQTARFPYRTKKDSYLVWLGRICEGKAPHLAMDAAESANLPLVVMGPSYLFPDDQEYFDRELLPRFSRNSKFRFVGSPSFTAKADILSRARALLMTSVLEETSSLVCLEAMACGTPVVALDNGALSEIVINGVTGLLTTSPGQIAAALASLSGLSSEACRHHVETNYDVRRMADNYQALYCRLTSGEALNWHRQLTSLESEAVRAGT